MPTKRIVAFTGTAQERQARRDEVRSANRQAMLQRMSPAQRMQALNQEQAFKADQAAKQKTEADAKIRDTKGIVGTEEEREAFRANKERVRRDDMLAAMTPEQREKALNDEAAFKQQEEQKKAAQEAQNKREADAKTRRTVGKVGSKEERQQHRQDKQRVKRDDMLAAMTPEERKAALAQEQAFHANEAAIKKQKADAKIRRTVSIVGDKSERDALRADKARIHRDDMLARMSPAEREQALKQEAEAKAFQEASEKLKQQQKEERTVAIVGDKAEREAFRKPRGTPTVYHTPGLTLSQFRMNQSLSLFEEAAA